MQKFIQITGSLRDEHPIEVPEVKTLLEDGWRITSVHPAAVAFAGDARHYGDVYSTVYLILEK